MKCPTCGHEGQPRAKFCRRCGTRLNTDQAAKSSSPVDQDETVLETAEAAAPAQVVAADYDIEELVAELFSRKRRRELQTEREQLIKEIDITLDRLKQGLLTREAATPDIQRLKKEVEELNKDIGSLPEETEIEFEIHSKDADIAKAKLTKLESMRIEGTISEASYNKVRKEYEIDLLDIETLRSAEFTKLKKAANSIEEILTKKRIAFEEILIRKETGELSEDEYKDKRKGLRKDIKAYDYAFGLLKKLLV